MRRSFFCIDGHTAGNPVRLVVGGAPLLAGADMAERRQDFMARFDDIRLGLMFEPRGHDLMSGGLLYPPTRPDCEVGILFIETIGCLPMCGHGTIGMMTFALEHGLIRPRTEGSFRAETPAGVIELSYERQGDKVVWVRIANVASFLDRAGLEIEVEGLGPLTVDIAYGGNFYIIVEPQPAYAGLEALSAQQILALSAQVRSAVRAVYEPVHPVDASIRGASHVLWADAPRQDDAHGRNAVFYGERAIDRSPCGTGTSARLAHLWATGRLGVDEPYVHESYIGSRFIGRVEALTEVAGRPAIRPSIQGSAFATGINHIWIDDQEPFPQGFQVQ